MNMQALQSLLAQQAAAPPKPALEFKAGLMTMTGTTVTADPRRGKVSILPGDDGLVHFQWTQRPGGNLEPVNDLVLFPGDSWERVPECKTGRVYLLRAGGSKRFFWMQEEKDDKDKEIETTLNKAINDPSSISGAGGGDGPSLNANDAEQEQLMQLLSSHGLLRNAPSGGPASGSAARPRPAAAPSTPANAPSTTPAAAPAAPARPAASSAAPTGSAPAAGAANPQQADALRALTQLMQSIQRQPQQQPLSLGAVADADRERADQERKQQQGAAGSASSQAPSSSAAPASSSAPSGSAPSSGSTSSGSSSSSGSNAGQSKPDPKDAAKK